VFVGMQASENNISFCELKYFKTWFVTLQDGPTFSSHTYLQSDLTLRHSESVIRDTLYFYCNLRMGPTSSSFLFLAGLSSLV